ncbi:MAG: metallophosphoesterase [Byssovorax sp.]
MHSNPLHAAGRGRNYTRLRALSELLMRAVYRGNWPARAWSLTPGRAMVQRLDHALCLDPARARAAPLRIAFASDLHLGPTTPSTVLDRAFDLLREAAPDVLILGGDYVFLEATPAIARELRDRVRSVPAQTKLAVMGNHDLWTHHGLIEEALASAGARVLINDAARLPAPWSDIAILGIDDPWTGAPDGDRAVAACGDAAFRIGISHSPDGLPFLRGKGLSFLLAGHTHGGQIALPGPTPIIVPGPLGKKWPFGLHHDGALPLFVSRGVGATELPIRTFAPPDIVVVTVT